MILSLMMLLATGSDGPIVLIVDTSERSVVSVEIFSGPFVSAADWVWHNGIDVVAAATAYSTSEGVIVFEAASDAPAAGFERMEED